MSSLETCEHGKPWWPPCARCCLPEAMDARGCGHDRWIDAIEQFADITLTPYSDIEVRANVRVCQQILAYHKHSRLSPERSAAPGVIVGLTTGDLLIRRERADDGEGTIVVIVRGDVVSRIRTR